MNIYKQKYSTIKEELKIFGTQNNYYLLDSKVKYSASFWKKKFISESGRNNKQTWSYVITEYMNFGCNCEERKFIDLMYFQCKKIVYISFHLHLCERSCYSWGREILNNLAGMAIQSKLLYIDMVNDSNAKVIKSKGKIDHEITDDEWSRIESILPKYTVGRPRKDFKRKVNGILYILYSGLPWRNLPESYGAWNTVYYHYKCWKRSGLWNKIKECLKFIPQ